ncbi:MAG TPA: GGDEF domain-containing protein, partial [Solirubrobacterales bacterium]|nr:GGDEF domain-containing protein [Solirubrobacterales bacterium]
PGVGFWLLNLVLTTGFITVALLLSRRLGVVDRQRRAHQRELEQRTSDLAVISEATRRLARTTESERARELVCEVALDVTGAPLAALLEPAGDGRGLKVTARIGGRDAAEALEFRDGSGEAEAFIRRSRVFDPDGERLVVEGLGSVLGVTARSALWQPVLQDRQAVGVLAIGWEERPEPPSAAKLEALEAVAADAAVAIDRAALLVRLDAMARTDELTGLHNRRAWEEELARERSRSARAGEPLCVAMIDLDNFKAYNDEHGHQAGDRFLREASAAWKSALRLIDVIARYGGEEFGILLPNCSLANAEQLLERLRDLTPDGATASCGLAEWDGTETGAEVVGRADAALYEAKRSGRDRTITASAASDQH